MGEVIELESANVGRILRLLKERGAWAYKTHGSQYGRAGVPDILACYRGRFMGIEVKRPRGGRFTKLQNYELGLIDAAGGVAIKAVGTADVEKALCNL